MFFDHLRDYERSYNSTYIGLVDNGVVRPVYVNRITGDSPNNAGFVGSVLSEDGMPEVDNREFKFRDPNLRLNPPRTGMIGSNGRLLFHARIPMRRWKQGYSPRSYDTKYLVYPDGVDRRVNVYDVFNPKYMAPNDAIDLCINSMRGYPITRNIAIVGNGEDSPRVLYQTSAIARINKGTVYVPHNHAPLADTLVRAGFDNISILQQPEEEREDVRLDNGHEENVDVHHRRFGVPPEHNPFLNREALEEHARRLRVHERQVRMAFGEGDNDE